MTKLTKVVEDALSQISDRPTDVDIYSAQDVALKPLLRDIRETPDIIVHRRHALYREFPHRSEISYNRHLVGIAKRNECEDQF